MHCRHFSDLPVHPGVHMNLETRFGFVSLIDALGLAASRAVHTVQLTDLLHQSNSICKIDKASTSVNIIKEKHSASLNYSSCMTQVIYYYQQGARAARTCSKNNVAKKITTLNFSYYKHFQKLYSVTTSIEVSVVVKIDKIFKIWKKHTIIRNR